MSKHQRRRERRRAVQRFALTPEERYRVRKLERAAAKVRGWRIPLREALLQWEDFVERVESGYGDADEWEYDYDNDLSLRHTLEEFMSAVPSLRDRLMEIIGPLDERFLAATRPTDFPRTGFLDANYRLARRDDVPWWAFRLPLTWCARPEEKLPPIWNERGDPAEWTSPPREPQIEE